jgi:RNA polymerase sigma-70 factor (ECF subfamily)
MEGTMRRHEGAVELDRHRGEADAELPAGRPAAADRDSRLVERLRRREVGAAEALVTAYGDRVYRLAVRITGNPSDAEEVAQDALWTASRKIDTFRGAAAFGSWLYRITANAAYQRLRERRSGRNEVSWEQLLQPFDRNGQHVEPVLDWSERVKDPAIEAELRAMLTSAIDALPGEYRATFLLRDVEGLTNSEVAATLRVKLTTIKSRVHRARLFLQRRLGQYVTEAAPAATLRGPTIA